MSLSDSASSSSGRASETFIVRFSVLFLPPLMTLFTLHDPARTPLYAHQMSAVPNYTCYMSHNTTRKSAMVTVIAMKCYSARQRLVVVRRPGTPVDADYICQMRFLFDI